ncbi:hypothetical protein PVAP13_2NG029800 [Panicum virgatum]|uniref:Uncharacterized protein n=1 Tax=Panicum virgatum TaxID=38727 RepID=A0A8T0VBE5_PANVG|nr:hypothetical protein PVAP13_2NG029800 [Panicum virgatum]KAG2633703.1 hypothetical protein PVAP13_2NG029800 [Panicum virgatum]
MEAAPAEADRGHCLGGSCRSGPSAWLGASCSAPSTTSPSSMDAHLRQLKKAADNQKVVEAIGVPLVRGPWYEASLEVGHQRKSVSCTFPVSGPHGSGFFQIEATRNEEDGLLSFLRHHDWEILTLEAHLHVPSDDEQQKTLVKVNLENNGGGQCDDPESGN